MEYDQIVKELVSLLTDSQVRAGDLDPTIIPTTTPVGGLKGFDSLAGVDATIDIEIHFGLPENPKRESLFVETGSKGIPRALTVGEIAQKIQEEKSRKK